MEEEELVFDYGEEGDLFYIILEGTVSIFIPDKSKWRGCGMGFG